MAMSQLHPHQVKGKLLFKFLLPAGLEGFGIDTC